MSHTFGAVIVAAGMSSRMGDFKPMMNLGNISIAQRLIATFHKAGIENITVVTGFKATELERHLAGNGIVFIRNENYETTEMFDSACIGLSYMQDKCSRVLFTPVDIPLFTAATVQALMKSENDLAIPVCEGKTGHPTLIASRLIPVILADSGEGGLKGALERCGTVMTHVPVNDRGILHDADTPEDYRTLLRYHNAQLIRPDVQVSLKKEKVFLDSNICLLLKLSDETGSVRKACERLQISYSSGWNTIRRIESQIEKPLIYRKQGGSGIRRSGLTEFGRELIRQYDAYTAAVRESAEELFDRYFNDIFEETD